MTLAYAYPNDTNSINYRKFIIGFLIFSAIVLSFFYMALKPKKMLPIYNPADVNPELVDSTVQYKSKYHTIADFSFTNQRGQRIHNMILRPPAFDPAKKYPLLVMMHGGPYSQIEDAWVLRWNYHLLSADGYVLLMTNFVGSTDQGEKFSQAIQGDPLKGPADDINQASDEAIRRYPFIDANRQCATGASYGGHLANWLQGTTTRYRCLISHAGLVNLESQWGTSDSSFDREISSGGPVWEQGAIWREQNPIRLAANFKTPVLVSFGEHDFRVPLNNGLEYWTALQRQKVESKLIIFPDENHWIMSGENSRYYYDQVRDWLKHYFDPLLSQSKGQVPTSLKSK